MKNYPRFRGVLQNLVMSRFSSVHRVRPRYGGRYGVLFELKEAAGVISTWSWGVVAGSVVRYTVMFGYPKMIVSFVAMFCLGRKSKLFRRAIRRTVTLKEMCAGEEGGQFARNMEKHEKP